MVFLNIIRLLMQEMRKRKIEKLNLNLVEIKNKIPSVDALLT